MVINVTAPPPPTPTVTPCATYKSQNGIGANATQVQANQALLDYFAGVIDQACANEIQASVASATPAHITAFAAPFLPPASIQYATGMTITVGITWKNIGGTTGTYAPSIYVNGTEFYPPGGGIVWHTLAAGASETVLFSVPIGGAGGFDICPSNNT